MIDEETLARLSVCACGTRPVILMASGDSFVAECLVCQRCSRKLTLEETIEDWNKIHGRKA